MPFIVTRRANRPAPALTLGPTPVTLSPFHVSSLPSIPHHLILEQNGSGDSAHFPNRNLNPQSSST